MCIEDDTDIRELLCEVLEAEGYEVVAVSTVLDALAHASTRDPDLVLVDLKLPGLGGAAFIRRYITLGRDPLRIIVITAAGSIEEVPPDVEAVIRKPFDIGELTATIARVLARPAARQPA